MQMGLIVLMIEDLTSETFSFSENAKFTHAVACSMTEAEYMVLTEAAKQGINLQDLLVVGQGFYLLEKV